MRPLLVLGLAACNQIYGLTGVSLTDGRVTIDAPTICPQTGTVPDYAHTPLQVLAQDCSNYQRTSAGDYAIAECFTKGVYGVLGGPVDGPLDQQIALPAGFIFPRLDPTGDKIIVSHYNGTAVDLVVLRDVAGAWTIDSMQPTNIVVVAISTIGRSGNSAHILVVDQTTSTHLIHEWVVTGGTWTEQGTPISLATFGFTQIGQLDLSPDGLRIIAGGVRNGDSVDGMYYLDRPAITAPFGAPQPIDLPFVEETFITADCTRVYYSGLQRVFASPRL